MQAAFVSKGFLSHIGGARIRRAIQNIINLVRESSQLPQSVIVNSSLHAHLHHEIGNDGDQIGVAASLAQSIEGPLHMTRARSHCRERIGNRLPGVIVGVNSHHTIGMLHHHLLCDAFHLIAHCAAIGVTQHQHRCAAIHRRLQTLHGVILVILKTIKKMLGIKKQLPS